MTTAAQQALRRTMEIYSNTKIIEPIQSRAAILQYTRISILLRMQMCAMEEVSYTDGGLEAIIITAEAMKRKENEDVIHLVSICWILCEMRASLT